MRLRTVSIRLVRSCLRQYLHFRLYISVEIAYFWEMTCNPRPRILMWFNNTQHTRKYRASYLLVPRCIVNLYYESPLVQQYTTYKKIQSVLSLCLSRRRLKLTSSALRPFSDPRVSRRRVSADLRGKKSRGDRTKSVASIFSTGKALHAAGSVQNEWKPCRCLVAGNDISCKERKEKAPGELPTCNLSLASLYH